MVEVIAGWQGSSRSRQNGDYVCVTKRKVRLFLDRQETCRQGAFLSVARARLQTKSALCACLETHSSILPSLLRLRHTLRLRHKHISSTTVLRQRYSSSIKRHQSQNILANNNSPHQQSRWVPSSPAYVPPLPPPLFTCNANTSLQFNSVVHAITACFMAVVNAIVTVIKAIISVSLHPPTFTLISILTIAPGNRRHLLRHRLGPHLRQGQAAQGHDECGLAFTNEEHQREVQPDRRSGRCCQDGMGYEGGLHQVRGRRLSRCICFLFGLSMTRWIQQ